MSFTGLLPVDKPLGLRSTDCVQRLRRILGRKIKIGHGGTLDSTATGLLFILTGGATRLANFVMALPKCYEAEVTFGVSTSTDDASGEVTARAGRSHITNEETESLLCGFLGWRMQSPPAVSAVHVDGLRAHELARGGLAVVPEARPVYFSKIERISDMDDAGRMKFRVFCSKGTYIRSFARDLGSALASAAHLSALRRVSCGSFTASNAYPAEKLFEMSSSELAASLLPIESLCREGAAYGADDEAAAKLSSGLPVTLDLLFRKNLPPACSKKLLVASPSLFSICGIARDGAKLKLSPDVNIKFSGGAED